MEQAANTISSAAPSNRALIIVTIMLVAILEVLDSTIVNVALPSMMPSLSANQEQITWVLTSYIVASAMMLPLTGFLSNRFGHKKLLIIDITGFMISSFACGLSNSLPMMIAFRLLQGGFGAALIPLSQSILRESFPLEEQGKAMAIWGLGIMAAPVFGPTLGGFITEHASWRWIFYLNTPFCLLALILTLMVVPAAKTIKSKIDWLGIALMFIGVGALQFVLDQGNSKNWFSSNEIIVLSVVSLLAIVFFIGRNLKSKNPVIKMSIYKDRNFTLSCIILAIFCGGFFALITLQPIMLENLFSYTSVLAGITMMPLGLGSAFGMIVSSQLMMRINVKYLLTAALLFGFAGSYALSTFNLNVPQSFFMWSDATIGFGMGLFMVPLATYSLATIAPQDITEGSGLFSYGRMLGSSIGISLFSTLVSRMMQTNWNTLSSHISAFNTGLQNWLHHAHLSLQAPQTAAVLGTQLAAQSSMIAFIDAFKIVALCFLILIPLVLSMKLVELKSDGPAGH